MIMPAALIACVVCLLVLVEQLFRRVPAGSRWGFKPICLALTAGAIFDLYFFADTLLFGGVDGDVWAARVSMPGRNTPWTSNPLQRVRMLCISTRCSHNWSTEPSC